MIGSKPAAPASKETGHGGAETAPRRPLERLRELPPWAGVAGCLVLGAISVAVLSWLPSSDPWAWIDWGQEIVSSKVSLTLLGGPSWKPFPVPFTAFFGLFGGLAPHLWLVLSRTAGLLALLGAYRVAKRFGGAAAGIIAVLALCLIQAWLFYFARGASEPIVVALTLWAIDRHLSGKPRLAYFLVFLATLNRPEYTPFLLLYAVYLWLRVPGTRVLAVALLVLVPVAWLGGPAVIMGDPLQAEHAALGGKGSPGTAIAELRSSGGLLGIPTLVLAAIGLGLAVRRRDRVLTSLGIAALAWAAMVAILTQVSYGLPRYLLPAGAIACVLAGVAFAWIIQEARRFGTLAAVAAGVVVLALTLPWSIPRARAVVRDGQNADQAAVYINRLFTTVERVGGRPRVLPCRSSRVAVNHTLASALAWKLKAPEARVMPAMRGTGFVFVAPHTLAAGAPPPIARLSSRSVRLIIRVTPWRVFEVTGRRASAVPHCAPGDRSPA